MTLKTFPELSKIIQIIKNITANNKFSIINFNPLYFRNEYNFILELLPLIISFLVEESAVVLYFILNGTPCI